MDKYASLLHKAQKGENIRVLMVYPEIPHGTYWGHEHALGFVGKKAVDPPLGLITLPGLFPKNYQFSLVDTNVTPLRVEQIQESDVIFASSMVVQAKTLDGVIAKAERQQKPVVLGGPYPTEHYALIKGNVVFVLNEGEQTVPLLVTDLQNGRIQKVYARPSTQEQLEDLLNFFKEGNITLERKPELTTPPAHFELLSMKDYYSMSIQISRGCPNGCRFCDVRILFGGKTRYKPIETTLAELTQLYNLGWRDAIFIADDNTIADKKAALDRFKAIAEWQKKHKHPYAFGTELSIDFADHPELLSTFVQAGGNFGFIGFETLNVKSLAECGKWVNLKEIMKLEGIDKKTMLSLNEEKTEELTQKYIQSTLEKVRAIQKAGIEVFGGFIYGFDADDKKTIDQQIEFIREAGIPVAMPGALTATRGTPLYNDMKKEGRLFCESSGNNTHSFTPNFKTKIDSNTFEREYKRLLSTLYDSTLKNFFERSQTLLDRLGENPHFARKVGRTEIRALLKSVKLFFKPYGWNYLKFLVNNAVHNTKRLPEAVRLGINGHHYRQVTEESLR